MNCELEGKDYVYPLLGNLYVAILSNMTMALFVFVLEGRDSQIQSGSGRVTVSSPEEWKPKHIARQSELASNYRGNSIQHTDLRHLFWC